MGIQGLIPFLEKASRRVNIEQYAGCCVAVDAYCWLHKGAYTCVEKLARGEPCDAYVYYCMKLVNMLLSHNIKPILVFDGRHLPAKAATEKKRREGRQSSRKRAAELLRAGRTDEARNFLRRCIDVTHEMALALIQECRRRNVDCIVAPYEADAQLAYLSIKNIAQIVITEDSDLVLFGCTKILFKMDLGGGGLLVEQERLHLAMGVKPENFSFDKFRHMCILSGCDYLPSLPGIGLSKACKFIVRTSDADIYRALSRLPTHLNMKSLRVSEEYRNEFILADATFRYQLVFDPLSRSLVHLTDPPDPQTVTDYAGKMLPHDTAYQLALGNLNPFTLEKVDSFDPDTVRQPQRVKTNSWKQVPVAPHPSIWSRSYKIPAPLPKPDPRDVERSSTKGRVVEKEIKITIPLKRVHEDISETCTDTDLTSMYSSSLATEPPAKRMRTDSCTVEEAEVEKENSPVTTPKKDPTSTTSSLEMTPVKQDPVDQFTSPVLTVGKSRRNPFFKASKLESPKKCTTEASPSLLGLREGATERKFSALSKFMRLRRTEIDEKTVVQKQQNNTKTKSTDSEQNTDVLQSPSLRDCEKLRDVSNTLNKSDISDLLDVDTYLLESPSKRYSPVKSDISTNLNNHKTVDSVSLLATLEMGQDNTSPKKTQPSIRKLIGTESENNDNKSKISSGLKSISKSFSWGHNKFGFQKSKNITSLDASSAVVKDFKNPFRKVDPTPAEQLGDHLKETISLSSDNNPKQTSSDSNLNQILLSSHRREEGEEDVEDSPSPADSGVETDPFPVSLPSRHKTVSARAQDSVTVDEGFHSPSSSQLSQSLPVALKSKAKICRRPGLSKSSTGGKQQSILSMFRFQEKLKLQPV